MVFARTVDGVPLNTLAKTSVICLALLIVGLLLGSPVETNWLGIISLALLALAAELLPTKLPNTGICVTVTLPIICAIIVLHGVIPGAIVDGAVTLIAGWQTLKHRKDLHRWVWLLFNFCQVTVSALGAGIIISYIVYNPHGPFTPQMLTASIVCVASYVLINCFFVAWMQSKIAGGSLRKALNSQWALVGPLYLLYGLMSLIIITPYAVTNGFSALFILLPVFAAKSCFGIRARHIRSYREMIRALGLMIQHAHPYTGGHLDRVAEWGEKTARLLNMSEKDAELIYDAALLHDIGKIAVDEEILNKPAKLDKFERAIVNTHPTVGASILCEIKLLEPIVEWIGAHHERPDGRGYPNGWNDDAIPLPSKIIAVVDAFDAMVGGDTPSEQRPYRKPMSQESALTELAVHSGTQFDPAVVKAFTQIVTEQAR